MKSSFQNTHEKTEPKELMNYPYLSLSDCDAIFLSLLSFSHFSKKILPKKPFFHIYNFVAGRCMSSRKRKIRRFFRLVRAEIGRQMAARSRRKKNLSFHYDPFSYSLNFDDGNFGFFSSS